MGGRWHFKTLKNWWNLENPKSALYLMEIYEDPFNPEIVPNPENVQKCGKTKTDLQNDMDISLIIIVINAGEKFSLNHLPCLSSKDNSVIRGSFLGFRLR